MYMASPQIPRGALIAMNVVSVIWLLWSVASWIAYYALDLAAEPPWWGGYY